jgi:hypothetical protein
LLFSNITLCEFHKQPDRPDYSPRAINLAVPDSHP